VRIEEGKNREIIYADPNWTMLSCPRPAAAAAAL